LFVRGQGGQDLGIARNGAGAMKKDIHPDYREVVFLDQSTGHKFLTRSTIRTKEKIKWEDGKEYPLVKVDISSASHPYFTGKMKYVDAAGRVEKFQKKYNWNKRKEGQAAESGEP
jgi:large subunit ribosomal protein L31